MNLLLLDVQVNANGLQAASVKLDPVSQIVHLSIRQVYPVKLLELYRYITLLMFMS